MSASVRCGALDDLDELPAAHHDASAVPESVVSTLASAPTPVRLSMALGHWPRSPQAV
ncbi:hypothetical protein [Phycicoccus elongatus]|uniref:hypothetical protein n=1 Tax=Phycicoccus elongatus TaxID=101689 RepID=UPI002BDEFCCE|nr:hypothetical protein [Phycicoccus elongatus]MBK8728106.1 hypothetical protein [Tetrasphaera sp.]HRC18317.1 hypothetical protein [Phycicoccus elongatus]